MVHSVNYGIIRYVCFIRRGGCSFSPIISNIINKISFSIAAISIFRLLFVSLVSAGRGGKKRSLPHPQSEDGQH